TVRSRAPPPQPPRGSDGPPIPPPAKASISASRSSARRRPSAGRGIPAVLLARRLEAGRLEGEVPAGGAAGEQPDDHADRAPLVDALAHQAPTPLSRHDLVAGQGGAP